MAPVPGPGHRVPVLVSGPKAAALMARLNAIGMSLELAGERIGDASLSKMLRSIFIKGIEAILLEGLIAAHRVGLEDRILDSVQQTVPGIDWKEAASYSFSNAPPNIARRRPKHLFGCDGRRLGLTGAHVIHRTSDRMGTNN